MFFMCYKYVNYVCVPRMFIWMYTQCIFIKRICITVLYRWSLPVVFGALVFRLSVWCGAEGYVS